MHKTCTGIKKTKKTKTLSIYSGLGVYRSQKFCFFCFFWCLCRFCEDHALFFLFFFDACACLVKVRVTKPAQASKKTKKNKPLDAQNLHRHQKKPKKTKLWASTQGWGSIDHKSFGFFGFFDACAGFVKIMLCFFFVFFDACAGFVKIMLSFVCFSQCLRMFCQSLPRWKNEKTCVSPAFQTLQVHKTL